MPSTKRQRFSFLFSVFCWLAKMYFRLLTQGNWNGKLNNFRSSDSSKSLSRKIKGERKRSSKDENERRRKLMEGSACDTAWKKAIMEFYSFLFATYRRWRFANFNFVSPRHLCSIALLQFLEMNLNATQIEVSCEIKFYWRQNTILCWWLLTAVNISNSLILYVNVF